LHDPCSGSHDLTDFPQQFPAARNLLLTCGMQSPPLPVSPNARSSFPPRPATGELFCGGSRFEVRRWIGEGAMGVVYEAYDRELRELVALKTLRHGGGRWLARFKREFRSLHDLAHPNLVALGELFEGDQRPFFTMELVRGAGLLDYLRGRATAPTGSVDRSADDDWSADPAAAPTLRAAAPGEPIACDEARLRATFAQLVRGVAALHDAGKVHRDLKPSNIMVTPGGRVVLLDLGLVADTLLGAESTDGGVVGTAAYMAPEQALAQVTPAADWYSVGVMLFEALTGTLPQRGGTPYETIMEKQRRAAPPPRLLVPSTPRDLNDLCAALLEIAPEDRPTAPAIFTRLGIDGADDRPVAPAKPAVGQSSGGGFVGRASQLAELRAAFDRGRHGPVICVIEGVSGVGKSRLAEQFLDELAAAADDTVTLTGRCYEREVVSYKAFDGIADTLARYLAHLPSDEVGALMPVRPALLARLFPVLKRVEAIARARFVPDVPDPHDQRLRMFAALRELFLRIAERRRLVWYIDDLQWTDADSLVLLQELVAHEDRLPVFIIATMRPVDSAPRRALVGELERIAPTQRLPLDELSPGEARELAALLLPDGDARTHDSIAAGAGGHPLFLHELARHAGPGADRATFDEMLTTRIRRLTDDEQRLLRVVAVHGGPLRQDVAAVAGELTSSAQIAATRVLRAAHLIRTDGVRRTDRIVTYHDRVREHVTASLDPGERAHLHERLALALERTGAAERDPRALVRHARAAANHPLAARCARMAARQAVTALAFDQAAEFFTTAIELGDHGGDALRSLRVELATALMHAGRGPEAAAMFMKAAEGGSPAERLHCQRQAADQWIITGHIDRGMNALRSSLADIGEPIAASPRRALARVLWNRTRLRLRGVRHTARREDQIAAETLRRLDVLRAVAHGLAMVDNIRGADFNGRYLLLALRTGEPRRLIGALATEAGFLASQGRRSRRRARRMFAELSRLAADHPDDPYTRSWLHIAEGTTEFLQGNFRPALRALEAVESVFAAGPAGLTYERNNARVFRVHVLRIMGAIRGQSALIAEQIRTGRQRGDRYLATTLELLQAHSLLARGNVDAARATVEGASWTPPATGFHLQHWYELRARVELAIYQGRASAAVDELLPRFAELDRSMIPRVQLVRAYATAVRARLLLAAAAEGRAPDRARTEVVRAVRRLERERVGYARVFGLLVRAGLAAFDGAAARPDQIAALRDTIAVATDNDMALHRATAQALLGQLVGGDEGARLRAAALAYARDEDVVAPDRLFSMIAPGALAGG
jgi:hypothetical protein